MVTILSAADRVVRGVETTAIQWFSEPQGPRLFTPSQQGGKTKRLFPDLKLKLARMSRILVLLWLNPILHVV